MPTITSDAFLWYSVGDWKEYGLAVPNWSKHELSVNESILEFCHDVGRHLQLVMFNEEAELATPPTIRTIREIHTMLIRSRTLLASRAIPESKMKILPLHGNPAAQTHMVWPVPFFKVQNRWLKSWCGYLLMALTDAMQHTENGAAFDISTTFAGDMGKYLHRIYFRIATELFGVSVAEAEKLDYTLTEEQLVAYSTKQIPRTERINTVPDLMRRPTEDMLKVLTDGISVAHLPPLGTYPHRTGGVVDPPVEAENGGTTNVGTSSFIVN